MNDDTQSKPVGGRTVGTVERRVEFESISTAVQELGLDTGAVSVVARGKVKKTRDWEFKCMQQYTKIEGEVWLTRCGEWC